MLSNRDSSREDARFRLLKVLETNPDMSQRELAAKLHVSLGSLHYMLRGLSEKGLVKIGNFAASSDKRRYIYVLTPKGIATKVQLTKRYLDRRKREYDALKSEIESLEAELTTGAPTSRQIRR